MVYLLCDSVPQKHIPYSSYSISTSRKPPKYLKWWSKKDRLSPLLQIRPSSRSIADTQVTQPHRTRLAGDHHNGLSPTRGTWLTSRSVPGGASSPAIHATQALGLSAASVLETAYRTGSDPAAWNGLSALSTRWCRDALCDPSASHVFRPRDAWPDEKLVPPTRVNRDFCLGTRVCALWRFRTSLMVRQPSSIASLVGAVWVHMRLAVKPTSSRSRFPRSCSNPSTIEASSVAPALHLLTPVLTAGRHDHLCRGTVSSSQARQGGTSSQLANELDALIHDQVC